VLRDDLLATFDKLEVHAMELRSEAAIQMLRAEIMGTGNDATWIRQLQDREHLLPEVVRQQARRWRGAAH